jgi:outer membrane protein TolC
VDAAVGELRREQVAVARGGYLPDLNLTAELVAGTGNVLRGSLFPTRGIPAVSGPPTGRGLTDAALGSLVGVSASWDLIGLAQRMAQVDAALAELDQALAESGARRLAIAYAAADQFLDLVGRTEAVRATQVALARARVFHTTVKALTDQSLRPGVDAARAAAELALAEVQLVRAEQAEAMSRVELARALGMAGQRIEVTPGGLLELPPSTPAGEAPRHPLLIEADATVKAAQARRRVTALSYLPRLDLVGALWIRGSGLVSGAVAPSPAAGLVPDTPNWATGLTFTWPLLELIAVRARTAAASAEVRVADARRQEVEQAIQAQLDEARALLDAAYREAASTPVTLAAARATSDQANARYRAGLATGVEVAEAERLLAQAEIDDAAARLRVRRAELLLARAAGDLGPFLATVRPGGR